MQIQETSCMKKTEQKNGYIYKTYVLERSSDEMSDLKRSGYERSGVERSMFEQLWRESACAYLTNYST
jgi:hypothetical protein